MNERRVAIVTGASRGIGRGIVLELVKDGFDVAGVATVYQPENKEKGLFEVKERVEELDGKFLPIQADLSNLEHHEKILQETLAEFGRIDVLVNNAGVAPKQRLDILETTPDSYDRVMSINTRGPFFLTQKIANQMIHQLENPKLQKPCIIFITSFSVTVSSPNRAEYCLSKAALSQAATVYAHRLAEFGINVYEIQPGIILTDMTSVVKEKYDKLIATGLIPQNRWGYPEDIGRAVVGLANGVFDYGTGLKIELSGGMNIRRL